MNLSSSDDMGLSARSVDLLQPSGHTAHGELNVHTVTVVVVLIEDRRGCGGRCRGCGCGGCRGGCRGWWLCRSRVLVTQAVEEHVCAMAVGKARVVKAAAASTHGLIPSDTVPWGGRGRMN